MPDKRAILDFDNIIRSTDVFEELFKNLDETEARTLKLAKALKDGLKVIDPTDTEAIMKANKALEGYEKIIAELIKQRKTAIPQRKKLNQLTDEELLQREKQKIIDKERVQRAKQLAILSREEKNSIAALRAQLSLNTLSWKKLTEAKTTDTKEGRRLVAQKKALTDQLKRLEKATGDNRREVGNYTIATSKLGKTLKRVFVGRDIASAIIRIGAALGDVIENNRETSEGIGRIAESFDLLKSTAEDVTVSFLEFVSTPVSDFFNNISFSIAKIRDFIAGLNTDTSRFGTVVQTAFRIMTTPARLLLNLLTDFPAILGGVINVFKEFGNVASSNFERVKLRAEQAFLEVKKGLLSITGSDVSEIDRQLNKINDALIKNTEQGKTLTNAYAEGYEAVKEEQAAFLIEQEKINKAKEDEAAAEKRKTESIKTQNAAIKEQQRLVNELTKANSARFNAILSLQEQVTKAEINNQEDKQARLLALEDLAFKELSKQRENNFNTFISNIEQQENVLIQIYGDNSAEVIAFRKAAGEELLKVESLNQSLEAEQLEASEKKKLEIRKKFAVEAIEIGTISVLKQENEAEKALLDEKVEQIDFTNDKIRELNEGLTKDLAASSVKLAEIISNNFKMESELAQQAIENQTEALETQKERAEQGLGNTLKFEQEELAKRQSEAIEAQKRERNAAEVLALYRLVAAYAQNGDENALQKALIDVSLLKASTGLTGFYDGTENVGKSLAGQQSFKGKDGFLGVAGGKPFRFDGDERIVNPTQNRALGNMSNDDLVRNALLGSAMSDSLPLLDSEHFRLQANQMTSKRAKQDNGTNALLNEVKDLKRAILKQSSNDYNIEKITDTTIQIAKKVQEGKMKRIERIKTGL